MKFQCSCMCLFHAFLMNVCIVSFWVFFFISLIGVLVHYLKNGNIWFEISALGSGEVFATSSRENHINCSGWVEVILQAPGVCKELCILYFGLLWRMLFATNPKVFVDSWLIFWFYSAFFLSFEGSSSWSSIVLPHSTFSWAWCLKWQHC